MKPEHLDILQHTLGADKYGRREHERNQFVTHPETDYGQLCCELVALGLMRDFGNLGELTGGDNLYRATDAGIEAMRDASPAPPKASRSKRRYDQYLSEDSGLSFGEWLKALKNREPFWSPG